MYNKRSNMDIDIENNDNEPTTKSEQWGRGGQTNRQGELSMEVRKLLVVLVDQHGDTVGRVSTRMRFCAEWRGRTERGHQDEAVCPLSPPLTVYFLTTVMKRSSKKGIK